MARIRTVRPEFWSDHETTNGAGSFWLYCIAETDAAQRGPCKVGIATNLDKRLSSIQGGNWRELALIWMVRLADRDRAKEAEQHCLSMFRPNPYGLSKRRALKSEWIDATPTEVMARALIYLNAEFDDIKVVA